MKIPPIYVEPNPLANYLKKGMKKMGRKKQAKRTYKDGLFRTLFNNKKALLDLYNALSGKNYPKGTPIRIVTLEECLFGDLKNDLAFIIDGRLIILIEHQSTVNPNMPFRMLCYLAREYEREFYSNDIYGKTLVQIPTPEMYVFYNGKEDIPLEQELKLSDAFFEKRDKLSVEVQRTVRLRIMVDSAEYFVSLQGGRTRCSLSYGER